jgi:hypothetical protein
MNKRKSIETTKYNITVDDLAEAIQGIRNQGYNPESLSINPIDMMLSNVKILYSRDNLIFEITEDELTKLSKLARNDGKNIETLNKEEINELMSVIRL